MTLSVLELALAAVAASVRETKNKATRIRYSSARVVYLQVRLRPDPLLHLFFDASGFAGQIAQVVELGPTHVAATLDRDRADRRAVGLEHALDAFAVRNLAHGERGVEATIATRNDDAFVGLHAFAVAFLHFHFDDHGVAGREVRNLLVEAFALELGNDVAHVALPIPFTCSVLGQFSLEFIQQPLLFSAQRPLRYQLRAP